MPRVGDRTVTGFAATLFLAGCTPLVFAQVSGSPVATVGPSGQFRTLQQAIDEAPETGETIRIAPGKYREKIHVNKSNIHLIGIGKQPQDVVLRQ